jgi:hypothetical protein
MKDLLDAFWRASAYCLHPRVILLSLAPLILAGGLTLLLGWMYWEAAVDAVRSTLDEWALLAPFFRWLENIGASGLRSVLAPLVIVAVAVPVIVVVSLLLVALTMTPALVSLVAARRFPQLERRHGASLLQGIAWSLGCTLLALVALAASIPLWFIPPLVLIVPPLIWGWLTWRVMAFDALADHAGTDERRAIMREHRWPMLGIGIIAGYLGAAPSLVWAFGAVALVFAPILIIVSVWLYTLVFAFSSLWFAHYALAALQRLRAQRESQALPQQAEPVTPVLPPVY